MKEDIIDDFSLPKYVKGKSFAEASKAIDKKFKDREDSFSESTKQELLSRLASAQEHIKMKEEAASGSNQMYNGGRVPVQAANALQPGQVNLSQPIQANVASGADIAAVGEGTPDAGMGAMSAGSVIGDAQTLMGFAQDAFGDTGIETDGTVGRQEQVKGAGWDAAGSGLKGAAAGVKYGGPVGAAIGAAIGVGSSLIGSSKKRKAILEGNKNAGLIENNAFTNDFDKGGKTNKIKRDNPLINYDLIDNDFRDLGIGDDASLHGVNGLNANQDFIDTKQKSTLGQKAATVGKDVAEWGKENYDSVLNAVPIGINALQLAKAERATPFSYDRLDGRYRSNQVDERSLENRVQNEATNTTRALANATNGSAGALRTNLIGSQLAKTNALSDAYLKAEKMNQDDDRFGQQFNNRIDMVNQRTSMLETNERRADEGAYESNKSMMASALAENIGDFGKQQMHKKMAIEATDYGWDGTYYVNKKDGTRITAEQYNKIFGTGKKEDNKNG